MQQQIKPWKTFDGFFLQNGQNCGFPRPRWSFSSFVIQLISWQPWCCDNIYLNYLQCRLQNTHERILERLSCWYRGSVWPKKTDPNSVRPQRMVNRVEGTESWQIAFSTLSLSSLFTKLNFTWVLVGCFWHKIDPKTDLNSGGDQKERSTEQIQIRADKVLFLRII